MKINYSIMFVAIVVAFSAGIIIGLYNTPEPVKEAVMKIIPQRATGPVDNTGFVPANVTIVGTKLMLQNSCIGISFDVTPDQAYSITQVLNNGDVARPLTHDIFRDVLENFNVTVLTIRIEQWDNEIYYARMFFQQGDKMLDLDTRPSDAIAMSLRTGKQLLINQTMLKERGSQTC